jgi:hypothetical protein
MSRRYETIEVSGDRRLILCFDSNMSETLEVTIESRPLLHASGGVQRGAYRYETGFNIEPAEVAKLRRFIREKKVAK